MSEAPVEQTDEGLTMRFDKCFYRDFAAAYGTCWLVLVTVATVTFSDINAGMFGFLGFPLIGLVYAVRQQRSRGA
jgi:hypothetical protein